MQYYSRQFLSSSVLFAALFVLFIGIKTQSRGYSSEASDWDGYPTNSHFQDRGPLDPREPGYIRLSYPGLSTDWSGDPIESSVDSAIITALDLILPSEAVLKKCLRIDEVSTAEREGMLLIVISEDGFPDGNYTVRPAVYWSDATINILATWKWVFRRGTTFTSAHLVKKPVPRTDLGWTLFRICLKGRDEGYDDTEYIEVFIPLNSPIYNPLSEEVFAAADSLFNSPIETLRTYDRFINSEDLLGVVSCFYPTATGFYLVPHIKNDSLRVVERRELVVGLELDVKKWYSFFSPNSSKPDTFSGMYTYKFQHVFGRWKITSHYRWDAP